MTRVSKNPLRKDIQERVWEIFLTSLSSLKKEVAMDFVNDLLSETEKVMLSKRLSIALMIIKGYNSSYIATTLKVSGSTVNSVRRWLSFGGQGYRLVLAKIIKKEELEIFFEDLDEDLLKLSHPKHWNQQLPIKKSKQIKKLL